MSAYSIEKYELSLHYLSLQLQRDHGGKNGIATKTLTFPGLSLSSILLSCQLNQLSVDKKISHHLVLLNEEVIRPQKEKIV